MKKSVLITGSSKGLGKELALVFASKKYDVILHGRNKKDLEKVKNQISKFNVECYVVVGDLKDYKTIEKLSKISKEKNISLLINNAGLHCPHLPLEKTDDNIIEDIITTNLLVPIKLTKRVYNYFMQKEDGAIININSMSGQQNHELRTIYSASKWGLRGFSETFKLEAKKYNVRILDVYPSRIKTKSEFTFGMEPKDVAQKIYDIYENTDDDIIKLEGRLAKK